MGKKESRMKYKIGDKVRVREDLEAGKDYGFYCNKEMAELKGKVVEIEDVDRGSYYIKDNLHCWTDEMFSGLVEPRNLMPLIAKKLGVEIGEEFKVSNKPDVYKFTEYSLIGIYDNKIYNPFSILYELIIGKEKIIKLPKKPILTEDEKVILRNIPKKYKYIARDECGELYAYENKPKKEGYRWIIVGSDWVLNNLNMFQHLFQFIKWEDEESYNIEELLKE
jgi:hypothetical protein